MKPICVPCQRFYRPKQNGFAFIEGMPRNNFVKPGKSEPENWEPYKLWFGDLWECEGCGHQTIAGVPPRPWSEHFHYDFKKKCKDHDATFQVNDC